MKSIIVLISILKMLTISSQALSAPVLNENSAVGSSVTVYPDSQDPNLYYFTPQYLGICSDKNGHAIFNFAVVKTGGIFSQKRGLMMTTFCAKEHDREMQNAFENILKQNPQAHFLGLPITNSSMSFADEVFKTMIEANSCNNVSGVLGQEESCSVMFTPNGKDIFLQTLRSGLAIVLQFQYTAQGFIRLPSGLQAFESRTGVAARISKSDFNGELEKYLPAPDDTTAPN